MIQYKIMRIDNMLNYNNQEDREKMRQYHRTRDMINLLTYFPEVSPIRNLTIVTSMDDYMRNIEVCKRFPGERNDTLITKPSMKSIEGTGIHPNIEEIFTRVKEMDPDGVLVLFDLIHEPSERYERYAGISIAISINNGVYIEAVGKGFDGREVSKGIVSHERYFIPWFELRRCNIENFKQYRTYLISDFDYQKSRNARVGFLCSLGLDKEVVLQNIPDKYSLIPDFIWLDVIRKILKKLEGMSEELLAVGLGECAISGHTEGKYYLPWQVFDKSRYDLTQSQVMVD